MQNTSIFLLKMYSKKYLQIYVVLITKNIFIKNFTHYNSECEKKYFL